MMWYRWHEGMGDWGGWHAGAIIGLVLLAVIIGLLVWGIVMLAKRAGSRSGSKNDSALVIARERYARGDISKEQFDQIKKDLCSSVLT
ncbi:MAG: SHOCT domain-containing protein [Chloroflexi bacterium]|nr:SHOCT domain-containing protein [Chloroflexota bacterium]